MELNVTERQTLRNNGQNFDSINQKIQNFKSLCKKEIPQSPIYYKIVCKIEGQLEIKRSEKENSPSRLLDIY
jgi:hypothetical protein